ncbi:DNRLRE domain-containing protein [Streptomyces sp. NPDC046374]|uniref:DNRLRE domain-containing protein n=1 Tax=Streptomyces sp. NPDC046374 TaxID=3154917 RepID=UPI0034017AFF
MNERMDLPDRWGGGSRWLRRGALPRIALSVAGLMAFETAVVVGTTGQAVALASQETAAERPAYATEAADLPSAQVAARLSGKRVEALSERTESTTTWANPDGTVTTDSASGPVRFRDGADGQWRDIDVELVKRDGVVAAKGHPLGLRLGGKTPAAQAAKVRASGASGKAGTAEVPLVTLAAGEGRELGLSWRGVLPEPKLSGTTARYEDALTATDLVIESTRTGFEQFLELKNRSAVAANGSVTLTLNAKGVKARANADRSVTFVDAKTGKQVGLLPAPVMWDATVDARSGEHTRRADVGLKVTQRGSRVDLTLTPDAKFLADPATKYPVTVDPAVNIGASFDTFVQQGYTTDQSTSTELRIGHDGGSQLARSFLHFPMAQITGKTVLSANLKLWNYHGLSCTPSSWEVWDTPHASTATRWTSQPNWTKKWATTTATKGFSSACADGWVSQDITDLAVAWAANGNAINAMGIKATNESDPNSWKKFNSGNAATNTPYVSVTYNTKPGVATPVAPANGAVTADTTPTLQGKATDADGNTVRLRFEVWNQNATTKVAGGDSAFIGPGSTGSWTSGALAPGVYKWRMSAYDGTDWNGIWSTWSTLTVDTSTPAAPSIVSAVYPADGLWHGNAGQAGAFAISDSSGVAVTAEYSLDGGATSSTTLTGGKGTVTLTPSTRGVHVLSVRVKNAAGTWSESADHTFYVGNLTGNLDTSFITELAETHFSQTLHPADDAEYVEPPAGEEYPAVDDTPAGYVEETDPEVVETEESAFSLPGVELPATAGASIVGTGANGDSQTVLDMPTGNPAPAELSATGLIVYPNTQTDADTLAIRTSASSVETFHLLRSAVAPKSYSYKLTLQSGQSAIETGDNGVLILDPSGNVTSVTAPTALDAKGQSIPVSLRLVEGNITVALNPGPGQVISYPVLLDPSYSTVYMTGAEARYCALNPIDCTWVKSSATEALNKAKQWYPQGTLYQGTGDSFRHCYWNARMEIRLSTTDTYEFATRHESDSSGVDKQMDMYNNAVGRQIGRNYTGVYGATTKVRDACRNAQRRGDLRIMKYGVLYRSNS